MSVGVTWLVEGHLLLLNSWGNVNVAELAAMDDRINEMLTNATVPLVHGIHDHSKALQIPSAKDLMKVKAGHNPRVGWLIIIGLDNKLMKFFVSVAGQVLNIRLRFMNSLDEALTFLQDIDGTLPNLKSIDLAAAEVRIHANAVTLEKLPEAS